LLIGHGSSRRPEANDTIREHAAALGATGRFAAVETWFLSDEDSEAATFAWAGAGDVYLVPLLMSDGYFVRVRIPEALGLEGRVTEADGRRLIYCDAIGLSPGMADIAARRVREACRDRNLDPAGAQVLLAGHGSTRDPASRQATERTVEHLEARHGFAGVSRAYLDEPPFLAEVMERAPADGPPLVVVGLFAADGGHAAEDIPRMIAARTDLTRSVLYTGAVGADPAIVDLILDEVARARESADACM
jgi:sirohydrochlorin cobaltochelatase